MKRVEFDEKCKACGGTGVYVGMAERDGTGVVCHSCKGTGCFHFMHEYEDFSCRTTKPELRVIYEVNPGIVVAPGVVPGGMCYNDWLAGQPFPKGSEMRQHTCPAWWYQCADYSKKPNWTNCCGVGTFYKCSQFELKETCWILWDKENG